MGFLLNFLGQEGVDLSSDPSSALLVFDEKAHGGDHLSVGGLRGSDEEVYNHIEGAFVAENTKLGQEKV